MKPVSKELDKFMNKHFKSIVQYIQSTTRFSNTSNKFLNNLYGWIIKSHISWDKRNNIYERSIDFQRELPKGSNYRYIPEEIRMNIENTPKAGKQIDFSIHDRNFQLFVIVPTFSEVSARTWNQYFQKVYMWLFVASHFAPKQCSKTMRIYLYLTQHKKFIPEIENQDIDRIHANTALTISCNTTTDIHLYREEEWFKVFIHETFHSFGLDFSEMNTAMSNREILNLFPVKSDVRLYESYTESFAEIINILFISHFSLSRQDYKISAVMEKAKVLLSYEIAFSLFQASKVLHYYGLSYSDLCNDTKEMRQMCKSKYKEKTHVLSYYIIKPILMFYMNDFIEWVSLHNRGSIQFNKTENNIYLFCRFIQEHYRLHEYNELMKTFQHWFSTNKLNIFETHTMRMTMFEL
jgi:hypothetical protein